MHPGNMVVSKLLDENTANIEKAKSLTASLSAAQMNWRPQPGNWSIAQNLDPPELQLRGGGIMQRVILPLCLCLAAIAPSSAIAQMNPGDPHVPGAVACNDSPTPGKRPPNTDCAVLLHKTFDILPPGPLVWRFENFSTIDGAQRAATPASVVLEAAGKVWLLTLAAKGDRSKGATLIAETEFLPPIPRGPSYEIVVSQANLGPDANVMTHKHSGP